MSRELAIADYRANPQIEARDREKLIEIYLLDKHGKPSAPRLISEYHARVSTQEQLVALFPTLAPVPSHPSHSQTFFIGQAVEAAPTVKYDEWRGVQLWIAAVDAQLRTGKVLYTVSESWPPASNGDLSDQWEASDLVARYPAGGAA